MLMLALMAVAMMTIQGAVALSTTLNAITSGTRTVAALDHARIAAAAVEEARARLTAIGTDKLIADPLALLGAPNPLWSAYVLSSDTWTAAADPEFNAAYTNYIPTTSLVSTTIRANSVQGALPYWLKIRHKREFDAEREGHAPSHPHYLDGDGDLSGHTALNPGNLVYYGYAGGSPGPVEFTTSSSTPFAPIEVVKAYTSSGVTQVYLARDIGPVLPGALYASGNVSLNGGVVNGTDGCGAGGPKPPVYTTVPATTTGTATFLPSAPAAGSSTVDILSYVQRLKHGAVVVTKDQDGTRYGSSSVYVTLYSSPDRQTPRNIGGLKLKNVTGHGLLLVEGDLTLDQNTTWNGLVFVTGTLTFKANSDKGVQVSGGIVSGSTVGLDSGVRIDYDTCRIARAMTSQPLKILRWKAL